MINIVQSVKKVTLTIKKQNTSAKPGQVKESEKNMVPFFFFINVTVRIFFEYNVTVYFILLSSRI